MPEPLTIEDFVPHIHTIFKIETPVALELELDRIADRSTPQIRQFSLLFKGPGSPRLRQGTYILLHAALHELSLFLVPFGDRDGHMVYQAAFTRLIGAPQAGPPG
jgi:hypothetical protein